MKSLTLLFLIAQAFSLLHAQTKTAPVIVHGKSVQLLPSTTVAVVGVGNVTAYFSTYNGSSGALLIDNARGGIVSGELRPRTSTPGLYEGGYAQSTPLIVVDYGSYAISIPTSDSDGNGIPDAIQYERIGTFTATGSGFSASSGLTFSMSVSFFRSAGSATGTYSATTQNSAGQSNTVSGVYSLLSYQGTVSYVRSTSNSMSLSVTGLFQGGLTATGSTTYTTTRTDQLSYAAFSIRDASGTTYQVRAGTMTRSGTVYRGTLSLVDGLPQTSWVDFTDYVIQFSDPNDANADGVPDLTDPTALPPSIATQPRSQNSTVGQNVTLTAVATGNPTYQWSKNGLLIATATSANLDLVNVQLADAGSYTVTAKNSSGVVTSNAAVLTVAVAPSPPVFTIQPISLTISRGNTVALTAAATGAPTPTLQWRKNGAALAGATNRILVIPAVESPSAGNYTCIATNASGNTLSSAANLAVSDTADLSRLTNLSVRTNAGPDAQTLIAGFVVGGPAAIGSKNLLVRASGPSLRQFGVPGALDDPTLRIFSGNSLLVTNDNWNGNAQIKSLATQFGAFAFDSDASKDAAVALENIVPAGYTAQIAGNAGVTGIALVEVYDATPSNQFTGTTPRLINLSARAQVGTDADVLIAGFVVGGTTAKTLLIRATGPALNAFGVLGPLSDPKLEIYAGSRLVNSNDNWAGDADIARLATSVGAFPLTAGSKDAALIVTLPPGSYSAQISGADSATGVALIEVYEIPRATAGQILLSDTFSSPSIDSSLWQVIRPFSGSSVTGTGGGALLTQRGTLVSVSSFPRSISVSGQVAFNSPVEHFSIHLRTDGLSSPSDRFGGRTGVSFHFTVDGPLSIQTGDAGIFGVKPYALSTGRFYDFTVSASGNTLTFAVNGVVELSVNSAFSTGDKIAFANREFAGVTSTLRNVKVTTLP
jgi:hypothetical protein